MDISWLLVAILVALPSVARSDVQAVGENGFQVQVAETIEGVPIAKVFDQLTHHWGAWWSSAHSYSGDSHRIKIDWDQQALVETLPDGGFVRHMQIVFCQPGKQLRMTGGLGPLQSMGLSGALTLSLAEREGQVQVVWSYNVSGFSPSGFKKLAPAVDRVLTEQLHRFQQYCETGHPVPEGSSEHRLVDKVVELSCGECQFNMEGDGCDLAIRFDGKALFVDGSGIDDHGDAHAPDGLCNAIRQARVTGTVVNGRFVAEKIEWIDDRSSDDKD